MLIEELASEVAGCTVDTLQCDYCHKEFYRNGETFNPYFIGRFKDKGKDFCDTVDLNDLCPACQRIVMQSIDKLIKAFNLF